MSCRSELYLLTCAEHSVIHLSWLKFSMSAIALIRGGLENGKTVFSLQHTARN